MNERNIRAVENLARTGISYDELRKAFPEFSIEEVEKIYVRIRKERRVLRREGSFLSNTFITSGLLRKAGRMMMII